MKIALVQLNPVIGDFSYNCNKIRQWAEKARAARCDLAVFPELAISGYPPQDLLERPAFIRDHEKAVASLVESIHGISVLCGTITRHSGQTGKPLHNSALLFENGEILFSCHKRLLPTYDVFDECRYFEPAYETPSQFRHKGRNLVFSICEDVWNDKNIAARQLYTIDPMEDLITDTGNSNRLMINIASSPFCLGKNRIKHEIFTNLCRKYNLPLLYVNQVGGQDSLLFDGQSLVMDHSGGIVALAGRFSEDMIMVDIDRLDAQTDTPYTLVGGEEDDIFSVYQALVMGVRDYVTKCGFRKGLIGLSGGIDSALTAAIACDALGRENVLGVALPSPYSSADSIADAKMLAANLEMEFQIIDITGIFQAETATLEPILGNIQYEVTEQNIQARIRGNVLMALSNKLGCMLLSTGNKSEMAVGYCTLYGDMSGGLAVISDTPKTLVYKLARHVNRDREIIPWNTINKVPSAELAPDQKDADELPPYEVLDPILKAYLEDNKSIDDIIGMGFDPEVVRDIVHRLQTNEYKRKQAPIGLKVTSKAFGYGRIYPTAEGYHEESSR